MKVSLATLWLFLVLAWGVQSAPKNVYRTETVKKSSPAGTARLFAYSPEKQALVLDVRFSQKDHQAFNSNGAAPSWVASSLCFQNAEEVTVSLSDIAPTLNFSAGSKPQYWMWVVQCNPEPVPDNCSPGHNPSPPNIVDISPPELGSTIPPNPDLTPTTGTPPPLTAETPSPTAIGTFTPSAPPITSPESPSTTYYPPIESSPGSPITETFSTPFYPITGTSTTTYTPPTTNPESLSTTTYTPPVTNPESTSTTASTPPTTDLESSFTAPYHPTSTETDTTTISSFPPTPNSSAPPANPESPSIETVFPNPPITETTPSSSNTHSTPIFSVPPATSPDSTSTTSYYPTNESAPSITTVPSTSTSSVPPTASPEPLNTTPYDPTITDTITPVTIPGSSSASPTELPFTVTPPSNTEIPPTVVNEVAPTTTAEEYLTIVPTAPSTNTSQLIPDAQAPCPHNQTAVPCNCTISEGPPKPAINLEEFLECRYDGNFLDPSDCGRFYRCEGGRAYLFNCPPGLHYDTQVDTCNWPKLGQASCKPTEKAKIRLLKN